MTAKSATNLQAVASRPANVLSNMQFRTIRPIAKSDIPISHGRRRGSTMKDLPVFKDFQAMLQTINDKNLNPCEIGGELLMTGPEIETERTKRKSFPQSFRKLLRAEVKSHGLHKQIDVMEFNKGERFFIVGR